MQFAWGSSGGIYQTTSVEAPPARPFLACESGLAAFDIFTGQTSEMSSKAEADGWTLHVGGERFESES